MERRHVQDDAGKVGAQDLRIGVLIARVEIFFRIQSDRDTVSDTTAATGALIRTSLANWLNRQPLHLCTVRIARNTCCTSINDVADSGHGQRGLSNICCQYHPATAMWLECATLLRIRQAAKEHDRIQIAVLARLDSFGGVANLTLTREEAQDVAIAFAHELVDGVAQPVDGVDLGLLDGARLCLIFHQ